MYKIRLRVRAHSAIFHTIFGLYAGRTHNAPARSLVRAYSLPFPPLPNFPQEMCFNIAKKCRAKAGVSSEMEGSSGASDVDEPRVHLESFLGTGDFLFAGTEGVTCMFSTRTVDAM